MKEDLVQDPSQSKIAEGPAVTLAKEIVFRAIGLSGGRQVAVGTRGGDQDHFYLRFRSSDGRYRVVYVSAEALDALKQLLSDTGWADEIIRFEVPDPKPIWDLVATTG